jgi:hypothetical protein
MDQELIRNIELFFKDKNIEYNLFDENQSRLLIQDLVIQYFFDINQRYLWEGKKDGFRKDYIDESEGLSFLKELLDKFEERIYLVITDDEFPPWQVLFFSKSYLIDLLKDNRYFEFFIFDGSMENIVFDTHDNSLILFQSISAKQ